MPLIKKNSEKVYLGKIKQLIVLTEEFSSLVSEKSEKILSILDHNISSG